MLYHQTLFIIPIVGTPLMLLHRKVATLNSAGAAEYDTVTLDRMPSGGW